MERLRRWMGMADRERDDFPWAHTWPEIVEPRVRAAFARVPRAAFVPEDLRRFADHDAPLPIGEGQTISQPFVIALMVQALELAPGDRVLEIGTGSGYQTAILCELTAQPDRQPDAPAGDTVYSIERFEVLERRAAAALAELGYRPHVRVGDGAAGWPEAAPFAGIIVSAAAPHVPRPLWDQLAEGGRLILPVGDTWGDQELWLVRKHEGKLRIRRMGGVRFVPLVSPILDDPRQWADE